VNEPGVNSIEFILTDVFEAPDHTLFRVNDVDVDETPFVFREHVISIFAFGETPLLLYELCT